MEVVGLLLDQGADIRTKDNVRFAASFSYHDLRFVYMI